VLPEFGGLEGLLTSILGSTKSHNWCVLSPHPKVAARYIGPMNHTVYEHTSPRCCHLSHPMMHHKYIQAHCEVFVLNRMLPPYASLQPHQCLLFQGLHQSKVPKSLFSVVKYCRYMTMRTPLLDVVTCPMP